MCYLWRRVDEDQWRNASIVRENKEFMINSINFGASLEVAE